MYEKVNTDCLFDYLESWVDTFNDCACCPLSNECDREDGIDSMVCADKLLDNLKEWGNNNENFQGMV